MRLVAVLLCAAGLAGCSGGDEPGEEATLEAVTTTVTVEAAVATGEAPPAGAGTLADVPTIVQNVSPAVVAVSVGDGEGSGVIWSEDGIVVTNNHVVQGNRNVAITFASGTHAEASVVATDPLTDLAVLQVKGAKLAPAQFDDRLPRVGELAVAIGNPLGFQSTVTAGIVSGVHRSIPAGGQQGAALVDLIQTDAAISPGNSGGALVDAGGKVVGINVAYIPPQARAVSIGFAIPSYTVVDVVEQLLDDGQVEHAFLGVRPADLTPQIAERFDVGAETGILVASVVEGSAAEQAGVEMGDVIVSIDGEPILKVDSLLAFLRRKAPGDKVRLGVVRDGEEREIEVQLDDRPE